MRSHLRIRTFVQALFVLLAFAVAALSVWAPKLAPSFVMDFPLAQAIALRGLIAGVSAACAVVLLLFAGVHRLARHKGGFAFVLALAFAFTAVGQVAVMASRGVSSGSALPRGGINVLQYNTLGGKVSVNQLAEVIQENSVNVVTLPETQASRGEELKEALAQRGLDFQVFDNGLSQYEAPYKSIVVLVARSLGEYTQVADAPSVLGVGVPAVYVQPKKEGQPEIISVHPQAPVQKNLQRWHGAIRRAYALCESHANAVIAGDFNSTRDHEVALGLSTLCRDALAEAKVGGIGTWPTRVPAFFGSPIDRVLMPAGWHANVGKVIDLGGSDHRGVLVHLQK